MWNIPAKEVHSMSNAEEKSTITRRAAIAGLSASGIGMALARANHHAAAQESTPAAMAGHPIVGTWIFDRDISVPSDVPSIVVFTADGSLLDPSQGVAGVWKATAARSAAWTLVPFIQGGAGGYVAVRSTAEVDASGNALAGPYSFTVVSPDGTVMTSGNADSTAIRMVVEPVEAGGKPIAGFPTWEPAPPPDATPAT
jgi:hypothetical protein